MAKSKVLIVEDDDSLVEVLTQGSDELFPSLPGHVDRSSAIPPAAYPP
jgi:hypothetical protein